MVEKTRDLVAPSWRGFAFLTAVVCLPLHATTLIVDPAGGVGVFTTIQAGINAANPAGGDTIQVNAATYTEQIVISKSVTLTGAGSATTFIQAPATTTPDPIIGAGSIVIVNNGATVSMSGFTVQGPGTSCSVSFGVGVYGNATLTFDANHVTSIRDEPLSGVQCGRAIQAGFTSQVGHVIVNNTAVDDYQKGGIVIAGAGSTGTISNTTVTGDGPESVIAQNGIVIIGGATATLTVNTVTGNDCDDTAAGCGPNPETDVESAGILVFSANATMSNNIVSNNDVGILAFNNTTGITASTSSNDSFSGNRYENIWVESATLSLTADTVGGTSNYAILALSTSGDVADSTVLVDCLSSITGPQQATNNNGTLTTASIVLGTCGTKTVAGTFTPGSEVTYTIVLNNSGTVALADNPGDEFTDVLPNTLTLVSAEASSGSALATIGTNTVTWNGPIAASDSVTITITATVSAEATPGTTVSNQGTITTDLDGNSTNETTRMTGATAGTEGATTFDVAVPTPVRLQSFDVE